MNREATTTEALQALIAAHAAEIAVLKAENEKLAQRVTDLEEQLRLERLHRYASDALMAAVIAALDMAAERGGAAGLDRTHCAAPGLGQRGAMAV